MPQGFQGRFPPSSPYSAQPLGSALALPTGLQAQLFCKNSASQLGTRVWVGVHSSDGLLESPPPLLSLSFFLDHVQAHRPELPGASHSPLSLCWPLASFFTASANYCPLRTCHFQVLLHITARAIAGCSMT